MAPGAARMPAEMPAPWKAGPAAASASSEAVVPGGILAVAPAARNRTETVVDDI